MRVRIQHADHGGCGHYRLIWPAQTLAAMGLDVTLHNDWPRAQYRPTASDTIPDQIVTVECDADVVVLQRPMEDSVVQSIPVLQRQGVAVVVELDDDFSSLPHGHPAKRATASVDRAGHRRPLNRRNLRLACEQADLVTCSTPAIADRYAAHGRVAILPNCIPARYLHIAAEPHDGVRVGWTGSVDTHVGDLQTAGDGIARALNGATFHVVGTGKGVAVALGLPDGQVQGCGWLPIDDYPAAYASLDVAVVPLADNPFNQAKSWLKGIEAAALGVPFVASPTVPYLDLAEKGAGLIAYEPFDWERYLVMLTNDPHWRQEIAGRGREAAKAWTVEGNAWRWAEAWERASMIRREKAAA
jgi:glycosyltransferase involved in cell wall biosynthesis